MMNRYDDGYLLAIRDINRFGLLFAMDKLHMLEDDFEEGYAHGIKNHPLNLTAK